MADLTPRQQEIKDLQDKGMTPPEIAKQLSISDNAVYQNLRRMRNATGTAKPAKAGKASAAPKPRRQSAPKPVTAESLLADEIKALQDDQANQKGIIEGATATIENATARMAELDAEIARKEDVLAVLRGEKVAHAKPAERPASKPRSRPSRARSAPKAASETPEAPAAPEAPAQAPQGGNEAAPGSAEIRESTVAAPEGTTSNGTPAPDPIAA